MEREEYLGYLRDLLSGDPERVRLANRALYAALVQPYWETDPSPSVEREADLVLAAVPQSVLH